MPEEPQIVLSTHRDLQSALDGQELSSAALRVMATEIKDLRKLVYAILNCPMCKGWGKMIPIDVISFPDGKSNPKNWSECSRCETKRKWAKERFDDSGEIKNQGEVVL